MQFDMNRSWKRATELVSANSQLLAILAGIFMFLPTLVLLLTASDLLQPENYMDPKANEEEAFRQVLSYFSALMPWMLALSLISSIGYAAMVALLGAKNLTVGEAIGQALKAIPSLIGAAIVLIILSLAALFIVLIPVVLVGFLVPILAPLLSAIAVVIALTYIYARFSLVIPALVLEGQLNPFMALLRSWKLTAPKHGAIFRFWALLMVVYLVISLLFAGLSELAGALGTADTGALIVGVLNAIVGAIFAMLVSALIVAIYEQTTAAPKDNLAETFD